MSKSFVSRLVQLDAELDQVVEFVTRKPEDERSALGTAATVGGVGALGYAGQSILRGRAWQKKVTGAADNSIGGLGAAFRTGHRMNVMAARGAWRGLKNSSAARKLSGMMM